MQTEIFEYVKQRRGGRYEKIGILYARRENTDTVRIGWSKANLNRDIFDEQDGLTIAQARTFSTKYIEPPVSLKNAMYAFQNRCSRYFKDCKIITE